MILKTHERDKNELVGCQSYTDAVGCSTDGRNEDLRILQADSPTFFVLLEQHFK
jgi:hypothetical protein